LRDDQNVENIIANIQNTKEFKSRTKTNPMFKTINTKDKFTESQAKLISESNQKDFSDTSDDKIKNTLNANVNPDPAFDLA